jgi:ferric-dicitrate binding protein FerR (iron transport regulator)
MPTRKQKRRRAKEHRHEYVWEDAEGKELDPSELPARRADSPSPRAPARSAREPQAPSWRRTLKRGLIFAPIMFVTVTLLSSDRTIGQRVTQTALLVVIFIPFSYFLDGVFWRSYKKRLARQEQSGRGRGS